MLLQLGPSSLNRRRSPNDSVHFLLACGFSHARLRHFFLDAGACRFVGFFLAFLLHRISLTTSRPKQYSSISYVSNNPRKTPPYLGRAPGPSVPAKVKAHADAVKIDRTRAARITLSRGKKILQTARAGRAKLHVLHVKRARKAIKAQPSAPESDEWQVRPGEKQSLNHFCWGKVLHAVVLFISPREQGTKMGGGF
jgi:hypothetical protein